MTEEQDPFENIFGKAEYNADGDLVLDVTVDEFPEKRGFDICYSGKGFGFGGCQIFIRGDRMGSDTECLSVETLASIIRQGAHQIAVALYRLDDRAWKEHPVPLPDGYRTADAVHDDLVKQGIVEP